MNKQQIKALNEVIELLRLFGDNDRISQIIEVLQPLTYPKLFTEQELLKDKEVWQDFTGIM